MKIAFLHNSNDPYTLQRIKYFIAKKHTVYSILFPSEKDQIKINGLNVLKLPDLKLNNIFMLKRIIYFFHIYILTKDLKLDILHVVNAQTIVLSFFGKSKKKIIENQGSDVLLIPKKYHWIKYIYNFFFKYIDGVIQDSFVSKKAGIKYGAPSKNNKVINIGVNLSTFDYKIKRGLARKIIGLNKDDLMIFSSRGYKELYNIDIIIKSIKKVKKIFKNVKYVFALDINQIGLEDIKYIEKNNLKKNIIFTGYIPHNQMPSYYRDSDLVLSVPSSDSSPFSVYESMAMKTACIVTDLPWVEENFVINRHLFTVPVRDVDSLAKKIVHFFNSKAILNLEEAYEIINNKINFLNENKKLEKFYLELLNHKTAHL